ncbi:MAG: prolyl-tRNA synthetase [Patescibacteria group bacterium]|nr:prolyl-tRNA synthetase [Patescibacteria group bacterium]MDE2217969.1 prolyl-tRNA synthetase [Patescibacteria group bacterium]
MKQSQLLSKTRKEAPKDEASKNAELLIRAGFIHKEMAGVYSFLPLGLRVLNRVNDIIREEMNAIGGQEILLTTLQDRELWEKTGRWSDEVVDNWFKTKLKSGTELGLGFTHEEPLTALMKNHVRSFRDLPLYPYQIQTKFRNEMRAKSGIMRGREFLMKDLYSFSRDEKEHSLFYEKAKLAYMSIFDKVGIGEMTYITSASGGTFSKYSDEFQTITDAGEDTVYVCEGCKIAINGEVLEGKKECHNCRLSDLKERKAVEVGNIFNLGIRFSEALNLTYLDEEGKEKFVVMGSYGLGPTRLIGTIAETLSDKDGLVWPKRVAPFDVHLVEISDENNEVRKVSERVYSMLKKRGVEVLFDDRELRAGEKFKDSDLIGIPLRLIVSKKTFDGGLFEVKERASGKISMIKEDDLCGFARDYLK